MKLRRTILNHRYISCLNKRFIGGLIFEKEFNRYDTRSDAFILYLGDRIYLHRKVNYARRDVDFYIFLPRGILRSVSYETNRSFALILKGDAELFIDIFYTRPKLFLDRWSETKCQNFSWEVTSVRGNIGISQSQCSNKTSGRAGDFHFPEPLPEFIGRSDLRPIFVPR